ncbi:unnamed protein product [Ceratitis capitata]|uniref:(Mediterranean fruit fly) hypothetical protein n=1 Tax=Ceratitis capitata TaxID=7213 RepID=A0A811V3M1_CERCA|nr:unnamed protein product [Ceratitis capitata]
MSMTSSSVEYTGPSVKTIDLSKRNVVNIANLRQNLLKENQSKVKKQAPPAVAPTAALTIRKRNYVLGQLEFVSHTVTVFEASRARKTAGELERSRKEKKPQKSHKESSNKGLAGIDLSASAKAGRKEKSVTSAEEIREEKNELPDSDDEQVSKKKRKKAKKTSKRNSDDDSSSDSEAEASSKKKKHKKHKKHSKKSRNTKNTRGRTKKLTAPQAATKKKKFGNASARPHQRPYCSVELTRI